MQRFSELNLSPELSRGVSEMGFETPTPIQAQTVPLLLGGPTDFLGMAATGTGKTAAFGIPLLEKIDPQKRALQAIVLCPTRELAIQVADQITKLGNHKRIHAQAIYGGAGYGEQIRGLKRGAYLLVATPGRLIDHLERGTISLADVETVVLDEADEMISMGFKDALEFVLSHVNKEKCRTWLFAATMSPELRRVANTYMRAPKTAEVNRKEMLSGTVTQIYYTVREKNKPKGLCKIIDEAQDFYGLIFCQTKSLVMDLTNYLRAQGHKVDCLHGDKSQFDRERTLALFRDKKVNVLVCSDVAARGLDVKDITHVVNFSLPHEMESYVHRIGRTGRSGKAGVAISLVSPAQMRMVDRVERHTKTKMLPGTFPTRKAISRKKLERLLPEYENALGFEKAREVLDENWIRVLEGLSKQEIAARFLALAHPELFDDSEQAEDEGLPSQQPKAKAARFMPRHERRDEGTDRDRDDDRGPRRPWKGPFQKHRHAGGRKPFKRHEAR